MNLHLCPDAAPGFLGIFDLSIAPPLLLYSYIPIFILCILFGLYVYRNDHSSPQSKYFLGITLSFSFWIFLILIQWVGVHLEIVHLAWQMLLLPEICIYLFSILFAYAFLYQRDVSKKYKYFLAMPFFIAAVLLPTKFNVASFDLVNCEGMVGISWSYTYALELVCLLIIPLIAIERIRKNKEHDEKARDILFSSGLLFFVGNFWASNFFGELSKIYEINFLGPVGLFLFFGVISYMIIKYKVFNAKLFTSQVLVVALWIIVAALLSIQRVDYIHVVVVFTLVLVSGLGYSLVKSVKREIEQREKIEKLAAELEVANTQLKELDRQKDILISIVSHQLNTPVTSVKWNIEMMLDGDMGEVSEEQKKQLLTIQTVTTDLADLVSMLLDVSRIQLGRMKVERTNLKLDELFNEILSVIDPKALQKKQKLVKNIPSKLPAAMLDKRLMRMTLENLLTNAVKYTPNGGEVTFTVTIVGNKLHYSVKDTGYGIPSVDQGKIFGQLFRASNVQEVDGNGLGLFVAKGAVEAQGGKIWFESTEDIGTTFFVEIPLV